MGEEWIQVIELVGPMAGSVLSTLILVVPILWGLLRFLGRAQANDIRSARVIERLCVGLAGMPKLVGAEVADVLRRDRSDSLDPDAADEYREAAKRAEFDAAQNLSDEETRELACAEIRRRYAD